MNIICPFRISVSGYGTHIVFAVSQQVKSKCTSPRWSTKEEPSKNKFVK